MNRSQMISIEMNMFWTWNYYEHSMQNTCKIIYISINTFEIRRVQAD